MPESARRRPSPAEVERRLSRAVVFLDLVSGELARGIEATDAREDRCSARICGLIELAGEIEDDLVGLINEY